MSVLKSNRENKVDDMSFFKKFKDRLTSPKARVSLQVNKNSFELGEMAEGALSVTSDEEFEAKEVRCEIQCVEEAKRTKYVNDPALNRQVLREVRVCDALLCKTSLRRANSHNPRVLTDISMQDKCTVWC